MNQDSKYYNELCDDAQQGIHRTIEKLEKARQHLADRKLLAPADLAFGIIRDLKISAKDIDRLPSLGED